MKYRTGKKGQPIKVLSKHTDLACVQFQNKTTGYVHYTEINPHEKTNTNKGAAKSPAKPVAKVQADTDLPAIPA